MVIVRDLQVKARERKMKTAIKTSGKMNSAKPEGGCTASIPSGR